MTSNGSVAHRRVPPLALLREMGCAELGRVLGVSRQRADQILYPKKHRARQMIADRVKRGALLRPDICDGCDAEGPTTAHHDDYERPLEIRWLCNFCHRGMSTKPQPIYPASKLVYPPELVKKIRAELYREGERRRRSGRIVAQRRCVDCGKMRDISWGYRDRIRRGYTPGIRCQPCQGRFAIANIKRPPARMNDACGHLDRKHYAFGKCRYCYLKAHWAEHCRIDPAFGEHQSRKRREAYQRRKARLGSPDDK